MNPRAGLPASCFRDRCIRPDSASRPDDDARHARPPQARAGGRQRALRAPSGGCRPNRLLPREAARPREAQPQGEGWLGSRTLSGCRSGAVIQEGSAILIGRLRLIQMPAPAFSWSCFGGGYWIRTSGAFAPGLQPGLIGRAIGTHQVKCVERASLSLAGRAQRQRSGGGPRVRRFDRGLAAPVISSSNVVLSN